MSVRHLSALFTRTRRLGVVALIVFGLLAGTALAASGGAGVGAAPSPAKKVVRRSTDANPFGGRGMWIWYISASNRGSLSSIISQARAYGVNTLMIKAGDGSSAWSQFNSSLVSTLHAHGLRVCAWQYVYGSNPLAEARIGAAAVKAGADCLLIDAEAQYEGKYISAQTYLTSLRQQIGGSFPVALAGFPYVDYHPAFPYSVFLGPGGAQYNVPQMYWKDIGTSVDAVYNHTFAYNKLFGRPIVPLGQIYSAPSTHDIVRFRQLSKAYGTTGVSWWDWQEAGSSQWHALARRTQWLASFTSTYQPPVLAPHSRGDLVVWAEEHLVSAGYPVAVDGKYSAALIAAVQSFQQAHGLTVDGLIGPATWQVLLRYAAAKVQWTSAGAQAITPLSTTVHAARAGTEIEQPVPATAKLRAVRNEIPGRLGAG